MTGRISYFWPFDPYMTPRMPQNMLNFKGYSPWLTLLIPILPQWGIGGAQICHWGGVFFSKNRLVVWFQVYITDTRPTTNRNWSLSSKGATAMCWMCHFLAQNGPFVLNKNFLVQIIIITFIYLLPLFIVQNLKKSYSRSRVMRMCHFWAQNGPLAPNNFFFWNLISFSSTY